MVLEWTRKIKGFCSFRFLVPGWTIPRAASYLWQLEQQVQWRQIGCAGSLLAVWSSRSRVHHVPFGSPLFQVVH